MACVLLHYLNRITAKSVPRESVSTSIRGKENLTAWKFMKLKLPIKRLTSASECAGYNTYRKLA